MSIVLYLNQTLSLDPHYCTSILQIEYLFKIQFFKFSEELVNIQPTLDTTLGDYICPVCNATFTSKIELGQHASEHGVTKEERKAVQPSNKHQHKVS